MLADAGRDADEMLGSVSARRKTVSTEIVAVNAVMGRLPARVLSDRGPGNGGRPRPRVQRQHRGDKHRRGGDLRDGQRAAHRGDRDERPAHALGSGNRANATIGRAVRLTIANALGAKTGRLDASCIGHPGKYSFCFAKRPLQPPWEPLRVAKGYPPEDTTVTIMATEGPRQVANHLNEDPAGVLNSFAAAMKVPSNFIAGKSGQVTVVLGHEHELALRERGWSRAAALDFLVEHSRVTPAELEAGGILLETGAQHDMTPGPDGRLPVVETADDIVLITTGGPGSGWSALIPSWAPAKHSRTATRRVRPPGEAMPDCGPDGCAVPWLTEEFIRGDGR